MAEHTDPTDQLSRLDLGPATPSLDAAAVRRAGDRRRRRSTAAVAVAAAVAVVAVATPVALALRGGPGGDVEPAGPGPTSSTTSSGDGVGQIPDDFRLDLGLTRPGGPPVDGPNEGQGLAIKPRLCGESGWPVRAGDLSPLDAQWVSIADENSMRARSLLSYTEGERPALVVDDLELALQDCPQQTTAGGTIEYQQIDLGRSTDIGDQSLTFSALYRAGGLSGNAIYQFFVVGSALVATVDYAEWSPQSVDAGARQLTDDNTALLDGLCTDFTYDDCGGS